MRDSHTEAKIRWCDPLTNQSSGSRKQERIVVPGTERDTNWFGSSSDIASWQATEGPKGNNTRLCRTLYLKQASAQIKVSKCFHTLKSCSPLSLSEALPCKKKKLRAFQVLHRQAFDFCLWTTSWVRVCHTSPFQNHFVAELKSSYCEDLPNGNYPNPGLVADIDARCSYISCSNKQTFLFHCSHGKWHVSNKEQQDWPPKDVLSCWCQSCVLKTEPGDNFSTELPFRATLWFKVRPTMQSPTGVLDLLWSLTKILDPRLFVADMHVFILKEYSPLSMQWKETKWMHIKIVRHEESLQETVRGSVFLAGSWNGDDPQTYHGGEATGDVMRWKKGDVIFMGPTDANVFCHVNSKKAIEICNKPVNPDH